MRRRIKRGLAQTQREGKWTGGIPTGFTTDPNGYLIVDGEEYELIRKAIIRNAGGEGESLRSLESDILVSRQSLSELIKTRKEWYTKGRVPELDDNCECEPTEAESRRLLPVQEALDEYYASD